MKTSAYDLVSETSETSDFLHFLRFALLVGSGVGNVGNTYRFPTFLRPPLPAVSEGLS